MFIGVLEISCNFSRFPDFPIFVIQGVLEVEEVTNYNVIYIIIYLYIYKYIIILYSSGKTNLGKSGNREFYTFLCIKAFQRFWVFHRRENNRF